MNLKNILLVGLGFIFLAIGVLGSFLPVLPTTPFVLLAAACFSVGSPKLQKKLKKSEFFKSYIEYYEKKTGVAKKTVIKSIVFVWIGLAISIYLTRNLWIALLLIGIGLAVSVYLTSLTEK